MKNKQHRYWLLAALFAPLAHYSGSGWLTAALTAAAVLPLTLVPKSWEGIGKPLAVIQLLWLGAVAGALLTESAAYWPSDNTLAVPLTILALAAWTSAAAAPRTGAVAAFCIFLLVIPALPSAAARVEPGWLKPTIGPWSWGLTLALLLPNLPAGEKGRGKELVYGGTMALILSAIAQGTISPGVAASVPNPFYQTARTLGHLEPVLAAAVTLGWYALAIYILQSARHIARECKIGRLWAGVLVLCTAAGAILLKWQLHAPFWSVLSAFLWVLTPFLTKNKKVENS